MSTAKVVKIDMPFGGRDWFMWAQWTMYYTVVQKRFLVVTGHVPSERGSFNCIRQGSMWVCSYVVF